MCSCTVRDPLKLVSLSADVVAMVFSVVYMIMCISVMLSVGLRDMSVITYHIHCLVHNSVHMCTSGVNMVVRTGVHHYTE